MTHVNTTQKTFGKETKKMIKSMIPTAAYFNKCGKSAVIKNIKGETVATWSAPRMGSFQNATLIIW
jgi:hypothetical protein